MVNSVLYSARPVTEPMCRSWFHKTFWGDYKAEEVKTDLFAPVSQEETTTEYRCNKCDRITSRFTDFHMGSFKLD